MKNAGLILNVVLLALVAVLFYLHFSEKKNSSTVIKSASNNVSSNKDFRIAYFEMDSVTNSFAKVKDVKSELSKEEDKMNSEIARLQRTYNERLAQYQQQKDMSQTQSEAASKDMMQLQESLRTQKQNMDQKYQDLYLRKMQEVKTEIEAFLKDYNHTRGYSYIFSNEPGFIYYKDTMFNITEDLIKGLNAQYTPNKK